MGEPTVPTGSLAAPLTRQQRSVWTAQQLNPDSDAWHLPFVYRLSGGVAIPALEKAVRHVLVRHPVLRTVVHEDADGTLWQRVLPVPERVLTVERLGQGDLDARVAQVIGERLGPRDRIRTRAVLLVRDADFAVLVLVFDHIAVDGPSIPTVLTDLGQAYASALEGSLSDSAPLTGYLEYTRWQHLWHDAEEGRADATFWDDYLPGSGGPLTLVDPDAGRVTSGIVPITVPKGLFAAANRLRVGVFAVLMAGYSIVLRHFLDPREPVVAFPAVDWRRAEFEPVVGLFTDMLLLRCPNVRGRSVREVVADVQDGLLDCLDHQSGSQDGLWARVRQRNGGGGARVSAAMSVDDSGWGGLDLVGSRVRPVRPARRDGKHDLLAFFEIDGQDVTGLLRYREDIFDEPVARRFAAAVSLVLEQIVSADGVQADAVALAADEASVVEDDAPAVHSDFRRFAEAHPDHLALVSDDLRLTYGQLNARSLALSEKLALLGLGRGTTVAICLPRSAEFVVTVLAVLRSGLAFLAVDVDQAEEHRAFAMKDAGAAAIVGLDGSPSRLTGPAVAVDGEPAYLVTARQPGRMPNSVVVPHRALANYARWLAERFGVGPADRFYFAAPPTHAASVAEFLVPLALGATVVLAGDDPATDLKRQRVTVAQLLPGQPDVTGHDDLRLLFRHVGAPKWAGEPAVVNLYGPPEVCVAAVADGRPIRGCRAEVRGMGGQVLPPGFPGELVLRGAPLASRYANRPGLISDRVATGVRVRLRSDGVIECADAEEQARGPVAAPGPAGAVERRIARLWAEVLGVDVDTIDRDADFFQQGGTSLGLIRLHRKLNDEVSAGITIADLLTYPTVAAMARTFGGAP